jgi:hypothetical protein
MLPSLLAREIQNGLKQLIAAMVLAADKHRSLPRPDEK